MLSFNISFVTRDKIQELSILNSGSGQPLLLTMLPCGQMIWQEFAAICNKSHQKIARRQLSVCMQLRKGFADMTHHISCMNIVSMHSRLRLRSANDRNKRT